MDSTTQLDPSLYQSLLGGASESLFPESLVTTMIVSFVILNILALLFFTFYLISLVRNWKVQSAVFEIQKDLAELKASLTKQEVSPRVNSTASANDVIASDDTTSSVS